MTLQDLLPDAPNGLPKAWQSIRDVAQPSAVHDEIMTDDVKPQISLSPIAATETASDYYSDFASDEEEIINHLLGNIAPPSPLTDAPLLVTDIEDYEEPRGIRLPKILGVERSIPFWLPRVQFQDQDQTVRDSDSSHSISYLPDHMAITLTY
jgi:hypothetical protein